MKKCSSLIVFVISAFILSGCGQSGDTTSGVQESEGAVSSSAKGFDFVSVEEGDPLYYLDIKAGQASSFDQTPDWAPEPDPMGAADGDMLTRWSSDYQTQKEWIYFDLGKERVVSNVVIRWERAFAKKFKVQVSFDAKKWKTVYNETGFKGGVADLKFPAVKCRYIKIQGVEKVEENWGISIWETEIYGPKSYNTGAELSREDYLSKGDEEEMVKEAADLVEKASAPLVSLDKNSFQQGVVYTSWMAEELLSPASDITLTNLKNMGYDAVGIMVPAYQDDLESDTVFTNDTPDGDTPTDESLIHAMQICHKIGLRVMLKPHVDPRTDEARIDIIASEKWFDSYEAFILRYAKLAEKEGAEMFSVGTELEATTFEAWSHRWLQLINKVKEVYSGKLTYSANWTEYEGVPFWSEMDFIGIDAYFPLTDIDDPTLEDIEAGWGKHADQIEAWLNKKGLADKGVILTEVGYTSTNGTNRQPWVAISATEDQQEQADCLNAAFDVLSKRPWFKGYYLWQYFPQERWSPLGFTVRNKKAEEVMRNWIGIFSQKT